MKRLLLLAALALTAASCGGEKPRPADYVNPNLGSVHSRWFFYTPAAEPFGLAKLGPTTNGSYTSPSGWEANGYEDIHTSIEGFPCLHEFQVAGVLLMPTVGEIQTLPGTLEQPDSGYRSRFDKADELARPGYYRVRLKDYGVEAELTATTRVGFQRYTFPESEASNILFDIGSWLGESGPVRDAWLRIVDPQTVEGYTIAEPTYAQKYQPGATIGTYFHARLSKPAASWKTFFRGGEPVEGDEVRGPGAGAALTFQTGEGERIEVKVGLSYTSVENARLNLESEASTLDFDGARRSAEAKWDEYLGRIEVEGGSEEDRVKFYTGLYHALLGRGCASDVNGAYPRNDGTVGQIPLDAEGRPLHKLYNTDAVWGAYWNLEQLWALAYPEYYSDYIRSHLRVYEDAGWLGDGLACSKYVSGVGTNMVSILMAGAYQCGIRDFDIEKGYEAALKNELQLDGSPFGASHTLEYSFSAYAVAQWAKALGREEDYRKLMWLSRGWERLYDPSTGLIRPRTTDGEFIDNFNPLESWRGFQEGNAVQYTFFVPHDPEGLIAKVGSEAFCNRLDSIFTEARKSVFGGGKVVNAFSGLENPYNHGNQPSLHISWLFNFAGKPYLTQKWTRLICDEFYGTTGEHGYGYGQDEDQGQLGAWYVMAAMGLFDVQGGTCTRPTFQLGSPQFDRIVIRSGSGKRFTIETEGNTPEAYYIQSAELNGEPLDACWFYRDRMTDGGTLRLHMGTEPNPQWGAATAPACTK